MMIRYFKGAIMFILWSIPGYRVSFQIPCYEGINQFKLSSSSSLGFGRGAMLASLLASFIFNKVALGLLALVIMILCVLFTNRTGNVLLERFHGLPAEERLHWRSFLVKLTTENLKTARDEEVFVASHKSVFIVYTVIGDICIFAVGKEVYDELALMEVLNAVTSSVKEVCRKDPSERLFLEKYGKVCLCLDEIISQGALEHTDKDRIRRLTRLKPLAE